MDIKWPWSISIIAILRALSINRKREFCWFSNSESFGKITNLYKTFVEMNNWSGSWYPSMNNWMVFEICPSIFPELNWKFNLIDSPDSRFDFSHFMLRSSSELREIRLILLSDSFLMINAPFNSLFFAVSANIKLGFSVIIGKTPSVK